MHQKTQKCHEHEKKTRFKIHYVHNLQCVPVSRQVNESFKWYIKGEAVHFYYNLYGFTYKNIIKGIYHLSFLQLGSIQALQGTHD